MASAEPRFYTRKLSALLASTLDIPAQPQTRERAGERRASLATNCVFHIVRSDAESLRRRQQRQKRAQEEENAIIVNTADNAITVHAEWLSEVGRDLDEILAGLYRAKLRLLRELRVPHFGESSTRLAAKDDIHFVVFSAEGRSAGDLTAAHVPRMALVGISFQERQATLEEIAEKSPQGCYVVLAMAETLRDRGYVVRKQTPANGSADYEEEASVMLAGALRAMLFARLVERQIFANLMDTSRQKDSENAHTQWWRTLFSHLFTEHGDATDVLAKHLERVLILDPRQNIWKAMQSAETHSMAVFADAPSPLGVQYLQPLNRASVTALLLYKTARYLLLPSLRAEDRETERYLRSVVLREMKIGFGDTESLWDESGGGMNERVRAPLTEYLYEKLYAAMDAITRTVVRSNVEELFVQMYAGERGSEAVSARSTRGKTDNTVRALPESDRDEAQYVLGALLDTLYAPMPLAPGGVPLDEWLQGE